MTTGPGLADCCAGLLFVLAFNSACMEETNYHDIALYIYICPVKYIFSMETIIPYFTGTTWAYIGGGGGGGVQGVQSNHPRTPLGRKPENIYFYENVIANCYFSKVHVTKYGPKFNQKKG